jgi:hypothetical protein
MIRPLKNIFYYLFILPRTLKRIRIINSILDELISDVNKVPEWRLITKKSGFILRMTQYVEVHSLLDFSLCGLANSEISSKELRACVYFCACLPLYDDFFDENNLSAKEIKALMLAPESFDSKSAVEGMFIHLLKEVYANLTNQKLFAYYFEKLFYAQEESKRLMDSSLSLEEVKHIAFEKGGYSALLFRSILSHEFVKGEKEALYQLGAVGQLMDDIFDLYDDVQEGLNTTATKYHNDFTPVVEFYKMEVLSLKNLFFKLDYDLSNKNKFIREIMLIVNGGTLCGKQFLEAQKVNNNIFSIQEIGREALICDMEKKSNWLKMVRLSISNA